MALHYSNAGHVKGPKFAIFIALFVTKCTRCERVRQTESWSTRKLGGVAGSFRRLTFAVVATAKAGS